MKELKLNKDLYPLEFIKTAADTYHDLCTISVVERSPYYICLFSDCIYNEEITKKEFENYLIDLLNSHGIINY